MKSSNSVIAVWLRTESCDNYLFLEEDVFDVEDMVCRIYNGLGDELAYVYDWEIQIIGSIVKSELSNAISQKKNDVSYEIHGDDA